MAGRLEEAAGHYGRALALRPAWAEGRLALATHPLRPRSATPRRATTSSGSRPREQGGGEAWALLGLAASRLGTTTRPSPRWDARAPWGSRARRCARVVLFETALLLNRTGQPRRGLRRPARVRERRPGQPHRDRGLRLVHVAAAADARRGPAREAARWCCWPAAAAITWRGRGAPRWAGWPSRSSCRVTRPSPTCTTRSAPTSRPTIRTRPLEEFQTELRLDPDHAEALHPDRPSRDTPRAARPRPCPLAEKAVALVPDVPAGRLVAGPRPARPGAHERGDRAARAGGASWPRRAPRCTSRCPAPTSGRAGRKTPTREREEFLRLDEATARRCPRRRED